MNERINKLKEQAKEKVISHGAYGETEIYREINVDKFAELIVKECMDVLRQAWYDENAKKVDDDPRSVAIQVGMKSGLIQASNVVAKHFGVR